MADFQGTLPHDDYAVPQGGNFVIQSAGGFAPPVPTPPTVTNFVPAVGSSIARDQVLQFDVTDNSGLFRRILVAADFPPIGLYEVVHDGGAFGPAYSARSSREAIAGGFRYRILRIQGWPVSPTIAPFAIDQEGAENA